MSHTSMQGGDDWYKEAGTCNQTGNKAPRFSWKGTPIGRTGLVACFCIGYHLGYDDDRVCKLNELPPANDMYRLFVRLLPWFPFHYNLVRSFKVAKSGYTGKVVPFNAGDVENRLRYTGSRPGRNGSNPVKRVYGVSTEHPMSIHQRLDKKLVVVYTRCSKEIMNRLKLGAEVSKQEAKEWGEI